MIKKAIRKAQHNCFSDQLCLARVSIPFCYKSTSVLNLVPRAIFAFKMTGVSARHFESGDGPGNEVASVL